MAKKPIKPLIRALAEHIADAVIASHDAGLPKRRRVPKEFYKQELAGETAEWEEGKLARLTTTQARAVAYQSPFCARDGLPTP